MTLLINPLLANNAPIGYVIEKEPHWVEPMRADDSATQWSEPSAGFFYYFVDNQLKIEENFTFHYIGLSKKIVDQHGVQNES